MRLAPAAVLTLLALPVAASAENWGDDVQSYTQFPEFARSKAICRGLKRVAPPSADRPDSATARSLRGCSSEALYFGIGQPADPVRARQCAFVERGAPDGSGGFSGDGMLITIYANGVGAARNFDVAIAIACQLGGAPAESDGRVTHLAKLKAEHWTGSDFDYCDDTTSGFAMGECASHQAKIADAERKKVFTALTVGWSDADQRALAALRKAERGFVDAHGGEVDASGTARGAMAVNEEQEQEADFVAMLRTLADGKAPVFTAEQLATADAKLNAAYGRIQHKTNPAEWGTVTKDGIRTAQRAWLHYRDAFVAFAGAKYPAVSADSIRGWLTEKRTEMLQSFAT